jgi:hypothetical protein
VIADRNAADLALSDLIVDRVRSHFGFDYICAENTPPGLVNDAYLSSIGRHLMLQFSAAPFNRDSNCYQASNLHVWANPIDQSNWDTFTAIIDSAVVDFPELTAATTHASRLILLFNYDIQSHVSTDIRQEFFAPLLRRFPGKLSYVDPETYGIPIEINDWNIHPTGMTQAWEGEYVFVERIPIAEVGRLVHEIYGASLKQGKPTHLPVREVNGTPCRFTLMPRYF